MWLTLNTHTYSQRLLFDGIMTFIRSKTDFLQTVYVLVEPDRYVANATSSYYEAAASKIANPMIHHGHPLKTA